MEQVDERSNASADKINGHNEAFPSRAGHAKTKQYLYMAVKIDPGLVARIQRNRVAIALQVRDADPETATAGLALASWAIWAIFKKRCASSASPYLGRMGLGC